MVLQHAPWRNQDTGYTVYIALHEGLIRAPDIPRDPCLLIGKSRPFFRDSMEVFFDGLMIEGLSPPASHVATNI